jgi:SRSO17 transposase
MSVSGWSGSTTGWERELSALKARIGPIFRRSELRETAGAFVDGLLSGISRKTGWLMAEQAGLARPWRMQALLGRSRWDADQLRDKVRDYVIETLGDRSGVLVVDETGSSNRPSVKPSQSFVHNRCQAYAGYRVVYAVDTKLIAAGWVP